MNAGRHRGVDASQRRHVRDLFPLPGPTPGSGGISCSSQPRSKVVCPHFHHAVLGILLEDDWKKQTKILRSKGNYICRFPTYTPGQQRGPSPPQNLGQRPPNAGDWLWRIISWSNSPLNQVVVPNSTRCTQECINNRSSSRQSTLTMCPRSCLASVLCVLCA